jgi:hypothetical protein
MPNPYEYNPPTDKEVLQALIKQLVREITAAKKSIYENKLEGNRRKKKLKELEAKLKEARREAKKKPKRAQLGRLPPAWKKHWVKVYDDMIARGVPKADASAIAWANVKRYCRRGEDAWVCAPYSDATFERVRKASKEARELKKEAQQAREFQGEIP